MTKQFTAISGGVRVLITIQDGCDGLDRMLTKEWQNDYYDFTDQDAALSNLAYNAVCNGVRDLSNLDGYADLIRGQATMRVYSDSEFEIEEGDQT